MVCHVIIATTLAESEKHKCTVGSHDSPGSGPNTKDLMEVILLYIKGCQHRFFLVSLCL